MIHPGKKGRLRRRFWNGSRAGVRCDGDVLVPGCGSGHDVRAIAAASPIAQVVGLDVAPSALDRARQFALCREARLISWRIFLIFPLN